MGEEPAIEEIVTSESPLTANIDLSRPSETEIPPEFTSFIGVLKQGTQHVRQEVSGSLTADTNAVDEVRARISFAAKSANNIRNGGPALGDLYNGLLDILQGSNKTPDVEITRELSGFDEVDRIIEGLGGAEITREQLTEGGKQVLYKLQQLARGYTGKSILFEQYLNHYKTLLQQHLLSVDARARGAQGSSSQAFNQYRGIISRTNLEVTPIADTRVGRRRQSRTIIEGEIKKIKNALKEFEEK